DFLAFHGASDHDLVSAPGVIGTAAVAGESAPEIRSREQRDLILNAKCHKRVVKSGERGTQLRQHFVLVQLDVTVMVPTAPMNEKCLARQAEVRAALDGA